MMTACVIVPLAIGALFAYAAWHEVLCAYRNPFPLFCNNDEKRFHEIVADRSRDYKTRSLLADAGYTRADHDG